MHFSVTSVDLHAPETRAILNPASIKQLMRTTCDYQLDLQAKNAATNKSDINYEWVRGAFYTGVMVMTEATGDSKYMNAALKYGEEMNWNLAIPETRHADWQCVGQMFLEMYMLRRDPRMLAGIKENIDRQMADSKPGRVDWWWCDSLYMAPPVLTRLAATTGDHRYIDFLNTMFWDAYEFLFEEEEQLYFRDENYFNSLTANGQKVFWSRGNGWVLAGLARLLDYLPHDEPSRPRYISLFQQMANRIAGLQQADGLWRTSLLDPEEFETGETSGTAFFTYAMAWGINSGLLVREQYEPIVKKGWVALAKAVTPEGKLGYVQGVAAAPGEVNPQDTREYAVGALLLAGSELLKLTKP